MSPWSDSQVWEAFAAHRWIPPSAKRVTTSDFDLAVTPGSPGLTWIYGFTARDSREAEHHLTEIRKQVESLGGTGARIQVSPQTRPSGLSELLVRHGFRATDAAEVLIWDLRDEFGNTRTPTFRPVDGMNVREILTREDYDTFQNLFNGIFELPTPAPEVQDVFIESYNRQIQESGHSDRFLAFEGTRAVGCAGLEISGRVAWFWGTGVLPETRGRGVYGALVDARCRSVSERGAEVVLVTARAGTSGPILKHHGFRVVGPLETLQAEWSSKGQP
jgi:GNAT superfamily N-acetyltransferase